MDLLVEVVQVTDALLAAVRAPNPDLEAAQRLLQLRGELLARLPEPTPSEKRQRLALLQQILAADAEVRRCLEERRLRVRAELGALARRGPRRRLPSSPNLLDQQV